MSLDALLTEAIGTYNRYRSPMATAELVDCDGNQFTVVFEGPFCRMCCDYDYFEDLIYELYAIDDDFGPVTIRDIDPLGGESFLVEFQIEMEAARG